ncbi:MAG: hypothetical protein ACR2QM_00545, partial [Longimicrobiales bacterium]
MNPPAGLAARLCFLFGLAGVSAACSPESGPERPWAGSLSSLPCADLLQSTLVGWGAGDEMFPGAPGPEFQRRFRFPTEELGEWLLLDAGADGAKITFVSPGQTLVRSVGEDCSSITMDEPSGTAADTADTFSDYDLRQVVESASAAGSNGVVIYVWSPHMPLSVDGYSEIASAAADAGLHLVAVLFPGSDRGFATPEARRAGVPDAGLLEAASVELMFRDALVHA